MNKAGLTQAVAEATGLKKKDAQLAVETIVDAIKDGLKTEGKVQLVGFGSWSVVERAARRGRNPQTGEEIDIPAKNVIKFKPGKNLTDEVNS